MDSSVKYFLLTWFAAFLSLTCLISCQNQLGFISLDCGLSANSNYTEPITGLDYISDEVFIDTGITKNISSKCWKNSLQLQLSSVRSFPRGTRNCYKIQVETDTKYLIRGSFLYGNYDGKGKIPGFDLHLGPNLWTSVVLTSENSIVHYELIHLPSSDSIDVCLVNTGNGIPFISALEFRPLKNSSYIMNKTQPGSSLSLLFRQDSGNRNNQSNYRDDVFDRIWSSLVPNIDCTDWTHLTTPLTVDPAIRHVYEPPSIVMSSASTPTNASAPLVISWPVSDTNAQYYVYMYFAELENLLSNQSRAFNISKNGKPYLTEPLSPAYLSTIVVYSETPSFGSNGRLTFELERTGTSTLPPILNALEVYFVLQLPQSGTDPEDVDAITNIKSFYGVRSRNWEGDPCGPKEYTWSGLECNYDDYDFPRITSLDLSSSGLTGEILAHISDLKMMEKLDLSNNSLIGSVPEFLSQLPLLRFLNLEGNNLSGSIPLQLTEKSNSGFLTLSVGENPNLCTTNSGKSENNIIVPVVASVGGVLAILLLLVAALLFFNLKRRSKQKQEVEIANVKLEDRNEPDLEKRKKLTYSRVQSITKKFEIMLGQGGFGRVYYGRLDKNEVAVKMLSPESVQGYAQFQAEVNLLMSVYHKNLTRLLGYCIEGTNMGLVYEYMGRGNLADLLLSENVLNWLDRIRIALDVAQGLEYLHNGCKPPIVHRDVKPTNILLNRNFEAKLADFGLSRVFPADGDTHVTTNVVGTTGYLDPQYHTTFRLTEKSDVYSFGVVLLELITGRGVITTSHEKSHISQWVGFKLAQGDIKAIIDPKLRGDDYNINSVWKAVEIAMSCVSFSSSHRPTMSVVVAELKDCLETELGPIEDIRDTVYILKDAV